MSSTYLSREEIGWAKPKCSE